MWKPARSFAALLLAASVVLPRVDSLGAPCLRRTPAEDEPDELAACLHSGLPAPLRDGVVRMEKVISRKLAQSIVNYLHVGALVEKSHGPFARTARSFWMRSTGL